MKKKNFFLFNKKGMVGFFCVPTQMIMVFIM